LLFQFQTGKLVGKKNRPIDLSISQEMYDSCKAVLDEIVELAEDKPLAAAKLSLKLQLALKQIERNAALKANENGKGVSWTRIGEVMGFGHAWAWERYKMGPTRQFGKRAIQTPLTGEMREDSAEAPESKMED
jgi:hypothetical protein